jgi:hypothetical protein
MIEPYVAKRLDAVVHAPRERGSTRDDWNELATRGRDGLEISLHWSRSADRVRITVVDQRLHESIPIEVDRADALSAFEHPFAFATPLDAPDYAERHSLSLRQQA